jgi:hypothetical protein
VCSLHLHQSTSPTPLPPPCREGLDLEGTRSIYINTIIIYVSIINPPTHVVVSNPRLDFAHVLV